MNREKAIRTRYYALLNGFVTYEGANVPVWDSKLESAEDIYILLTDQSAVEDGAFNQQKMRCDFQVEIVSKQDDTVSKDVLDDISETIEGILYSAMQTGIEYEGWQVNNFRLQSVNYVDYMVSDTKSIVRKDLVFSQTVTKI